MNTRALIISLFIAFAIPVIGGSEVGGGRATDNIEDLQKSAWFARTDREIKYCAKFGKDFGMDKEKTVSLIQQAFGIWTEYIERKKITGGFATKLTSVDCDNTQDLTFYFGVTNPVVRKYRAKYVNPTAFSARTSYDLEDSWGRGFVWVASEKSVLPEFQFPNWSARPKALLAVLVHEFGHIFGCDHISGTIMSPDLSVLLQGQMLEEDVRLSNIDWARELARTWKAEWRTVYTGEVIETKPYHKGALQHLRDVFKLFTGKNAKGKVSMKLVMHGGNGWDALILQDEEKEYDVGKPLIDSVTQLDSEKKAFRVARVYSLGRTNPKTGKPELGYYCLGYPDYSSVLIGQASKLKGVPLILEYNSGNLTPVVLSVIADEGVKWTVSFFNKDKPYTQPAPKQ